LEHRSLNSVSITLDMDFPQDDAADDRLPSARHFDLETGVRRAHEP
jgi:hypothetical protein